MLPIKKKKPKKTKFFYESQEGIAKNNKMLEITRKKEKKHQKQQLFESFFIYFAMRKNEVFLSYHDIIKNLKKWKSAYQTLSSFNFYKLGFEPKMQIVMTLHLHSKNTKILIPLDNKHIFLELKNIFEIFQFEIRNIIYAPGFMEVLKLSEAYKLIKMKKQVSNGLEIEDKNFWANNSDLCLSTITNALVKEMYSLKYEDEENKNFWFYQGYFFFNQNNELLVELKNEYHFFNYMLDLSSNFSTENLLQNPNIQQLSFLYTSQIFSRLQILKNQKILEVRFDNNSLYGNITKISLVFSLSQRKISKIQEIVILFDKEEFFIELNAIINFFSLDLETILKIAQNSQDSHILKFSEWIENRKLSDFGSLKFSFEYEEQLKSCLKFINQEKKGIIYSYYQKKIKKGDFSNLYDTITCLIRRKSTFVLSSFSFLFIRDIFSSLFPFKLLEAKVFSSYQLKFLVKINWMTKYFLYFIQKMKTKRGCLKIRKEIFREIYAKLLAEFENKLERYLETTNFFDGNLLRKCFLNFYLFD